MAVPTLTSITPTRGHTGGGLVRLTGTNFRPQTEQSNPTGPLPMPPPSVAVYFGAQAVARVRVLSDTLLEVQTGEQDPGVVDVTVKNLDDDGVLLSGEQVTLVAGYTFARPNLTVMQALTRITEAVGRKLRRQVVDPVVPLTHTDYDDDTGDNLNIAVLPKLPCLLLLGPMLLPAPDVPAGDLIFQESGDDVTVFQPAVVKHLRYRLIGCSNATIELLNLLDVTRKFFKKNPFVEMDKDADDPSAGQNQYPLVVEAEPQVQGGPNADNLRQFAMSFQLKNFYFEGIDGFTDDGALEKTKKAETVTLLPSVVITVQTEDA